MPKHPYEISLTDEQIVATGRLAVSEGRPFHGMLEHFFREGVARCRESSAAWPASAGGVEGVQHRRGNPDAESGDSTNGEAVPA